MKQLLFILLIIVTFEAQAQSPFGISKEPAKKNLFFFELMGGAVLPSMKYTGTSFDTYQNRWYFDKTAGLALRFERSQRFSVSTQFSYSGQGVYFPDNRDYKLNTNYLNIYVPLELDCLLTGKKKKSGPCFIVYAGPYIAKQISGKLITSTLDAELGENDVASWDYGIEGGLGLRIPTYSLSGHSNLTIRASYYYGLANTFPTSIGYDAAQMNERILSTNGSRNQCGVKIMLTYGMSLEKKEVSTFTAGGDGKKTFKRFLIK